MDSFSCSCGSCPGGIVSEQLRCPWRMSDSLSCSCGSCMLLEESEPALQEEPSSGAAAQGVDAGADPEPVLQEEPSSGAAAQRAGAGAEPEPMLQDEAEPEPVLQDEPSPGAAAQGAGAGAEPELMLQEEPSPGAATQGAGAEPEPVLQDEAEPEPVLQDEPSPGAAAQGAGAGADPEPVLLEEPSLGAAAQGAGAELEPVLQDKAEPEPVLQDELSPGAAAQGVGAEPEPVLQDEPSPGAAAQGAGAEPVLQEEPSLGAAAQGAGAELEPVLQDEVESEPMLQDELSPGAAAQGAEAKPKPVLQDEPSPGAVAQEAGAELEPVLQDGAAHEIEEAPSDVHIRQGTIEHLNPLARLLRNKYALRCTSIASIITISLAYDQAMMSGAATYIKMDLKISDAHLQFLTGILGVFTLLGLALARLISDCFGRRWTIMTAGALFFLGPIIMGSTHNYAVFLVGRSFANLGAGFASMIAPVYVAEISPTFSRGIFISFPEVFLSIGTLLANLSNYGFSKFSLNLGWHLMVIVGAIPSVVLAFTVFALPESPQWLIMQGRLDEANQIIYKISNSTEEAALWLDDIKKAAGVSEEGNGDIVTNANQNTGVWRDIFHPTRPIFHLLICAILIQFLQQACGIETLLLYSPQIFERVRITTSFGKLLANTTIDMVKIVVVLFATFLVDRVGRRPLLLSSIGGMVLWLVSLGVFFILIDHHNHKKLSWAVHMCLISVIFYMISYSIGLGPITGVYCSEIFPPRLHAQGYAIGIGVKNAVKIGLSLTYLQIYKAITLGGAAILFAGIAFLGWVPLYMVMPETKGRKLEEIGQLFGKFIKWRSAARDAEMQEAAARDVEMQRT